MGITTSLPIKRTIVIQQILVCARDLLFRHRPKLLDDFICPLFVKRHIDAALDGNSDFARCHVHIDGIAVVHVRLELEQPLHPFGTEQAFHDGSGIIEILLVERDFLIEAFAVDFGRSLDGVFHLVGQLGFLNLDLDVHLHQPGGVLLRRADELDVLDHPRRIGKDFVLDQFVILDERFGIDHRPDDGLDGGTDARAFGLFNAHAVASGIDKLGLIRHHRQDKQKCGTRRKEEYDMLFMLFHGLLLFFF